MFLFIYLNQHDKHSYLCKLFYLHGILYVKRMSAGKVITHTYTHIITTLRIINEILEKLCLLISM